MDDDEPTGELASYRDLMLRDGMAVTADRDAVRGHGPADILVPFHRTHAPVLARHRWRVVDQSRSTISWTTSAPLRVVALELHHPVRAAALIVADTILSFQQPEAPSPADVHQRVQARITALLDGEFGTPLELPDDPAADCLATLLLDDVAELGGLRTHDWLPSAAAVLTMTAWTRPELADAARALYPTT